MKSTRSKQQTKRGELFQIYGSHSGRYNAQTTRRHSRGRFGQRISPLTGPSNSTEGPFPPSDIPAAVNIKTRLIARGRLWLQLCIAPTRRHVSSCKLNQIPTNSFATFCHSKIRLPRGPPCVCGCVCSVARGVGDYLRCRRYISRLHHVEW
jgi:hypothetical protein